MVSNAVGYTASGGIVLAVAGAAGSCASKCGTAGPAFQRTSTRTSSLSFIKLAALNMSGGAGWDLDLPSLTACAASRPSDRADLGIEEMAHDFRSSFHWSWVRS